MSLVAHHLEAANIATVIVGSARDIVEECGVARFVFTDLPLGNPLGPPGDVEAQENTVTLALDLVRSATHPRTTIQAAVQWPDDDWRSSYMRVDDHTRADLEAAGEARRAAQRKRAEPT